jgi:hypothetical protein
MRIVRCFVAKQLALELQTLLAQFDELSHEAIELQVQLSLVRMFQPSMPDFLFN